MIVLSHTSALEYWLSVRTGSRSFVSVSYARFVGAQTPRLEYEKDSGPWWLTRPLHVLVTQKSARRLSRDLETHLWSGTLPKGSVLDTQNGFAVCSPELCFLQMSSLLTIHELIMLGFELCGRYDLDCGELRMCEPLTTTVKLRAFAKKSYMAKGRKKALRALQYVADNSASPRETELAMKLCLPRLLGGHGIKRPVLNHRFEVGAQYKKITRKSFFVGDLCWPRYRLIVEYDSDAYHASENKIARDASRSTALEAMGFIVITITNKHITDASSMRETAHAIAKCTQQRLQYKEPDFTYARTELWSVFSSNCRYSLKA